MAMAQGTVIPVIDLDDDDDDDDHIQILSTPPPSTSGAPQPNGQSSQSSSTSTVNLNVTPTVKGKMQHLFHRSSNGGNNGFVLNGACKTETPDNKHKAPPMDIIVSEAAAVVVENSSNDSSSGVDAVNNNDIDVQMMVESVEDSGNVEESDEARNIFDVLLPGASTAGTSSTTMAAAMESSTVANGENDGNPKSTNGNEESAESIAGTSGAGNSRKRNSSVMENGDHHESMERTSSKQRKPSSVVLEVSSASSSGCSCVRTDVMRTNLHSRAITKMNAQCACDKVRREFEEKAKYWRAKYSAQSTLIDELQEQVRSLRAELKKPEQRHVTTQIESTPLVKLPPSQPQQPPQALPKSTAPRPQPVEVTLDDRSPERSTAPKPSVMPPVAHTPPTAASAAAGTTQGMPNLMRYPSPSTATSMMGPSRAGASAVQPPRRGTPVSSPGSLPPRLPLSKMGPPPPVNQQANYGGASAEHISVVSPTSTAGGPRVLANIAPPARVQTMTPSVSTSSSTKQPSPGFQNSTRSGPIAPPSTARPNGYAGSTVASDLNLANRMSFGAPPPRLLRAPGNNGPNASAIGSSLMGGAPRPPAPTAVAMSSEGRVLMRPAVPSAIVNVARPRDPSQPPNMGARPKLPQHLQQAHQHQPQPPPQRFVAQSQAQMYNGAAAVMGHLRNFGHHAHPGVTSQPLGFYPPLPELRSPNHLPQSIPNRPHPPKPALKVVQLPDERVQLRWDMPPLTDVVLRGYRVFSYKANTNEPWTSVGGIVQPMGLPMAVIMSNCEPNNTYYFVMAAEDILGRCGPFSDVSMISI